MGRAKNHGLVKRHARAYFAWNDMVRRCFDQSRPNYRLYGGRGITLWARISRGMPLDKALQPRLLPHGGYHGAC